MSGFVTRSAWLVFAATIAGAGGWGVGVVEHAAADPGGRLIRGPLSTTERALAGADMPVDLPLAAGAAGPSQGESAAPLRAVPGRLVVKYRDTLDACAHCLLAGGKAFASAGASPSLDRLHAELGVRAAEALFVDRHGLDATQAQAAFRARLRAATDRFSPARRARVRLGAVPDLTRVYELTIARDVDVHAAAARYAADPAVVYAHPVYEVEASFTPNDPYYGTSGSWGQSYPDLWGLHAINAGAAWDVAQGEGTVIAVLDTGVDPSHPDLAGRLWTNSAEIANNGIDDDGNGYVDDVRGWDFHYRDNDPLDRHGHGTHVAGTAAAVGNNGLGIVGAAFRGRIMALQGLSDDGRGFTSRLAQALVYAAENGADVINNSWGGFGLNEAIYDAVAAADALGAVVSSAAGNSGSRISGLLWLPAGHPKGLTVGAMAPEGTLASFSNFGPVQSLVAPGVDVLSLLSSRHVWEPGVLVGGRYARLSGTSMATPHASGAAALVLSADPTLTPAEVRWRLELNADQPGYPGYEGQLHNPTYGYGRLNAATAFAAPPVTTRLSPPRVREWHGFPERQAIPGKPGTFDFTTLDPVVWSVTTPPWLVAETPSGAGPATLAVDLEATGVAPGTYQADVTLDVPAAVDGGAAFSATLHVHRDERLGPNVVLGQNGYGQFVGWTPDSASNALRTVVAWQASGEDYGLQLAAIDAGGTVAGPARVARAGVYDLSLASDGHEFLLVWLQYAYRDNEIRMARVRGDGVLLDTEPLLLYSRRDSLCRGLGVAGVGHDGVSYVVVVTETNWCGGRTTLYGWRVYPDGSAGKATKVYKASEVLFPLLACRPGACLLVWMRVVPEAVEPGTLKYVRGGYALRVNLDSRLKAPPVKIVDDTFFFTDFASDGTNFLAVSQRYFFCAPGDLCRTEVIGTRIDATGAALDPAAIVVSNAPPTDRVYPWPQSVVHDGTQWVVSYGVTAVRDSPFENGSYLFVNRLDANGTPLEREYIGMLVDAGGRASTSRLSATATETTVVWEDGRFDPIEGIYGHPAFSAHVAQRLFPRAPGNAFDERAIGTIGEQSVGERQTLRLRVRAAGAEPGTVSYVLAGLPDGAVLDATTGLFQWRPSGVEAGSYVATISALADGNVVASEDVNVTVPERVHSVSGLVRFPDGTPVVGAALKVRGTSDKERTISTDAAGRYRVEGFVPGANVSVKLTRPSTREYRGAPVSLSAAAGDVQAPDLVVTAK